MDKITFERSGGFVAAPGLMVKGTLHLKPDDTAEVLSERAGYERQLSPQEWRALKDALDSVNLEKLPSDLRNPRGADQYQYAITFHRADGKTDTVQVDDSPASELENSAAGLGRLTDWVRKETDAIWKRRIR